MSINDMYKGWWIKELNRRVAQQMDVDFDEWFRNLNQDDYDVNIDPAADDSNDTTYLYQREVDEIIASEIYGAIKLLDLPNSFREEDLHRAYRKKSKEAHPDTGGSHEEFLRIRKAYEYLKEYFNID